MRDEYEEGDRVQLLGAELEVQGLVEDGVLGAVLRHRLLLLHHAAVRAQLKHANVGC